MNSEIDWSLYLVTDRELAGDRSVEDVIAAGVKGGVTVVQLREKNCSTLEYILLAKKVKRVLKFAGVPLIINDRIDVALACQADGVHVGQNDMPYQEARRLMGPNAIIGLTVETMDQARQAENLDADYLGVSAIYGTPTKTDTINEWGLDGLQHLRGQTKHLLVAIGGINKSNAANVIQAGADGIAVVSAICAAPDPESAAKELFSIISQVRKDRQK
jgi:thiamine-phosphate pyrophosphorylase